MNIFICGYMGAGKSTVAKTLAMQLKRPFIDLDKFIEYKLEQSISSIFKDKGEAFFRDLEFEYLQDLMKKESHIIALGGGSLSHHNLHQRIRKAGLLVYLEASSNFLYERLKNEKELRPLISSMNENELQSFISTQLAEREAHYLNAQLRIDVQNKTPQEIAAFISEYLEMY